jgi:hypothetical protein
MKGETNKQIKELHCASCGMILNDAAEYHPLAVCYVFKVSLSSERTRSHVKSLIEDSPQFKALAAALDAAEQRERDAVAWVSVKNRLPEYFGFYLATVAGLDELLVMPVWFDRVDQCFKTTDHHNEDPGKVIAWMRLPEPYTAED